MMYVVWKLISGVWILISSFFFVQVDITAHGGDLILNSLYSTIKAQAPSSINAIDENLRITRDVAITRKSDTSATFTIKAFKLLEITSTVELVGPGPLNASNYFTTLELEAGQIDIGPVAAIHTYNITDELFIHPSCAGENCRMLLGTFVFFCCVCISHWLGMSPSIIIPEHEWGRIQ